MKINSINSYNLNYCSKKINKRQSAAALVLLLLSQTPKTNAQTYDQIYRPTPIVQQETSYYSNTSEKIDPRIPKGSDFYYAYLQYGDKYKIQSHYDPGRHGIGSYYQYGNQAFTKKEGKKIDNPENLHGFKPINDGTYVHSSTPTPSAPSYQPNYSPYYSPNYQPNYSYDNIPCLPLYPLHPDDRGCVRIQNTPTPTPTPKSKMDSRIPKGSDFYYAYLQYGDKYKIRTHWDSEYGKYYQYGPMAFDKKGNIISNTSCLRGFDN